MTGPYLEQFRDIVSHCYAYNSTDSWKLPIHVSDWLILCCGNLILHKKRNENHKKHKFYNEKQQKNAKKVYEALSNMFLRTRSTDL